MIIPSIGISNDEEISFGFLNPEGLLSFSDSVKKSDVIAGPGTIDPQDAQKLLKQVIPVTAVTYDSLTDGEYDALLQDKDALITYHQMAHDGTIKNAIDYLYGSLRSARWLIEPASNEDEDLEMAAFVMDQLGLDDRGFNKYSINRLFQLYKQSWIYGESYGEIVLAPGATGKIILDKIIPINPFVIDELKFDNMGGPKELIISGEIRGGEKSISNKKIPIYKTISFIHNDNGTFKGTSMLRSAIGHWRVKRSLIILINQGMERFLIGVPIVKIPKTVRKGTDKWREAENIARNFVTRPRTGIILPKDWEFEVAKLPVAMPDAKPLLEYHDSSVARSLGIDFNTVRQLDGNTQMNLNAFINLTENTTDTLRREFASNVNLHLIPKLCILNWPNATKFPILSFEGKSKEDYSASANLLGMIINASIRTSAKTVLDASGKTHTEQGTSEEVVTRVQDLLRALPLRFQRSLGVDENEQQENLNQFREGASTGYKRDARKTTYKN